MRKYLLSGIILILTVFGGYSQGRKTENFNAGWRFFLGDAKNAEAPSFDDTNWRTLNLPHDWSIEGKFDQKNPSTFNEGALPTGIGWYRKTFTLPASSNGKDVFIDFDGIYRYSEVWINGRSLGMRPNGYISFEYDLTPYLRFGGKNVISVKVNNSDQPNSRWYSGSGIYRNVWLVTKAKTHFTWGGTFVTTPTVNGDKATVQVHTTLVPKAGPLQLKISVYKDQKLIATNLSAVSSTDDTTVVFADRKLIVNKPALWSAANPNLYQVKIALLSKGQVLDEQTVHTGIRAFHFDPDKGFFVNGQPTKILGVCLHHDAGALGAVVNKRAIERQLQILKAMGCNAIRTSHNPPSPEFLDACDRMGFLVLDEAFDMWRKKKNKFDYYRDFDKWHEADLRDQVLRDRNHPSIFAWSIGNEIREQFDSTGISVARELVGIVKKYDNTRPVTSALSEWDPKKNFIYQSGALDLVGLNYHQEIYADFHKYYPGKIFLGTEQMSALATRGHYDPPADTTVLWPSSSKQKFAKGNPDYTVSAYDNVAAYWGSTHETTWKLIKKYDFLSGLFVWTGFDYLGEPVPYPWPARSSYYGIVDMAGFPKDVYYMYRSEWTSKPVLHLLPHWNWKAGQTIDVWAYYSQADEVELFLNGRSLGIRRKEGDDLHVNWKVKFEPGILKAVSRKKGKVILTTQVVTAGAPYQLKVIADRSKIKADGNDLSYLTIQVLDKNGVIVPDANNAITLSINGPAQVKGMDNGYPADLDPLMASTHNAFNGLCLGIIQSQAKIGAVNVIATSPGLKSAKVSLVTVM